MTPTSVCFVAAANSSCSNTATTAAVVVAVETPATLPLGYSFGNTAELRTSVTRTVLAFLPFGVLAFCVRRRRRLSKALWMLMVISAVSAGMTGCGGNQVNFYTPIPTGPQTVTVIATYPTTGVTRSYTLPINID
jgi:peptidoglycan/LPS O-acetylase OafA/YrhL